MAGDQQAHLQIVDRYFQETEHNTHLLPALLADSSGDRRKTEGKQGRRRDAAWDVGLTVRVNV